MNFEEIVKIPDERKGVLLGKKKKMKEIIEKMGGVELRVRGGAVIVSGKDSIKVMKAAEVVKAIGFGFNPYDAFELFREDTQFVIYDIEEAVVSQKDVKRQVGRIIGEGGRAKRFFEKALGIKIVVRGEKVGAIGTPEKLEIFREALEKLVHGSPHASVYRYVERRLASLRELNI